MPMPPISLVCGQHTESLQQCLLSVTLLRSIEEKNYNLTTERSWKLIKLPWQLCPAESVSLLLASTSFCGFVTLSNIFFFVNNDEKKKLLS